MIGSKRGIWTGLAGILVAISQVACSNGDSGPTDAGLLCGDVYTTPDAGACLSAADLSLLLLPDGGLGPGLQAEGSCALTCFDELINDATCDPERCIDACFTASPASGLSQSCRACLSDNLICIRTYCITDCAAGSSPACDQCLVDSGCNAALEACSGLVAP